MAITLDGTNGLVLPSWNTGGRPNTSVSGQVGFNSSTNTLDVYSTSPSFPGWNTVAYGPLFSVYATAGQVLTTTALQKVLLQNKLYDTAGCFNNTAANTIINGINVAGYSFAPNVPGYYQLNYAVRQTTSASEIVVNVCLNNPNGNGGSILQGSNPTTSAFLSAGSGLVYLNGTTDYVNMSIYVGAGVTVSSRTSTIGSNTFGYDTFFQGYFLRGI